MDEKGDKLHPLSAQPCCPIHMKNKTWSHKLRMAKGVDSGLTQHTSETNKADPSFLAGDDASCGFACEIVRETRKSHLSAVDFCFQESMFIKRRRASGRASIYLHFTSLFPLLLPAYIYGTLFFFYLLSSSLFPTTT